MSNLEVSFEALCYQYLIIFDNSLSSTVWRQQKCREIQVREFHEKNYVESKSLKLLLAGRNTSLSFDDTSVSSAAAVRIHYVHLRRRDLPGHSRSFKVTAFGSIS